MAKAEAAAKSSPRPTSKIKQSGGLEIDQDMDFQRGAWLVQRIGWTVMALIVFAALLGLFGTGPLSQMTAGTVDGPVWVEYGRFARYKSPLALTIHLGPVAVREGKVRLWFSQSYLAALEIQRVTPEPTTVEISGDHFIYTFEVVDTSQAIVIMFHMQSDKIGSVAGQMGVIDGPTLTFNQIFYP